jgi:hypothetical protein
MNDNTIRLSKNSLTTENTMIRKLRVKLGMMENESFQNGCQTLGAWTKYSFAGLYGYRNDFDYFRGDVYHMLKDFRKNSRYNILFEDYDNTEITGLTFNELIHYLRNDWKKGTFLAIHNRDYSRIMMVSESGYRWKNFEFPDQLLLRDRK